MKVASSAWRSISWDLAPRTSPPAPPTASSCRLTSRDGARCVLLRAQIRLKATSMFPRVASRKDDISHPPSPFNVGLRLRRARSMSRRPALCNNASRASPELPGDGLLDHPERPTQWVRWGVALGNRDVAIGHDQAERVFRFWLWLDR